MDHELSDLGPCLKRIQVRLDAQEVDQEFTRNYAQLRRQVVLPGFRPGKAPRRVLEKRFGHQVGAEVTQELVQSSIEKVLEELDLDVVSPPKMVEEEDRTFRAEPGSELLFGFEIEVRPPFDLPPYKGLQVERKQESVGDEEIQGFIEARARERAVLEPAPTDDFEPGDQVCGDLAILDGDRELKRLEEVLVSAAEPTVEGFLILDLNETLAGHRLEDTVELQVQTPPAWEHAGQTYDKIVLSGTLKIIELKREVPPDIDDDLAKELGQEDLAHLKQEVRRLMEQSAQQEADHDMVRQILDKLLEQVEIPLAEGPTERMLLARKRELGMRMLLSGVPEEEVRAKVEEKSQDLQARVERDTRAWLLLEKIAQQEKIFVLEEEVDRKIEEIASEQGTTPSKLREEYESREMMSELRANLLEEKVCLFLKEQAEITNAETAESKEESGTAAGSTES